jgi:hypothetical protein
MTDAAEDMELAEQMRQRDVLVQVERFLRYAPRGTDPAVLRQEAALWAGRLEGLAGANEAKARQLARKLRTLAG